MGGNQSKDFREIEALTISMRPDEIKQYFSGTWHEQVRTNLIFEKGCKDSVAEYTYSDTVQIVNSCYRGEKKTIARLQAVKLNTTNDKASFRVGLTNLMMSTYNILYLADDVAVVAGDSWRALWVLSRDKHISHEKLCRVLAHFAKYLEKEKLVYNDGTPCEWRNRCAQRYKPY